MKLPKSAQSQENAWTVTSGPDAAAGSWGGHCVNLVGFSATGPVCVTWGRLMPMSWEFFASYCDEAYALVSPDFLIDGKAAPNGLNLSQLSTTPARCAGSPRRRRVRPPTVLEERTETPKKRAGVTWRLGRRRTHASA